MADSHDFCRQLVRSLRREYRNFPHVSTSNFQLDEYTVFIGDFYAEYNSCCSFDAKQQGMNEYIELHNHPRKRWNMKMLSYFANDNGIICSKINNCKVKIHGDSITRYDKDFDLTLAKKMTIAEAVELMGLDRPK